MNWGAAFYRLNHLFGEPFYKLNRQEGGFLVDIATIWSKLGLEGGFKMNEILKSARELDDIVTKVNHLLSEKNELIKRGTVEKEKIKKWFKAHNDKQEIKELIEQCPDKEAYKGLKYVLRHSSMVNHRSLVAEIEKEFLKEKGVSIKNSFK